MVFSVSFTVPSPPPRREDMKAWAAGVQAEACGAILAWERKNERYWLRTADFLMAVTLPMYDYCEDGRKVREHCVNDIANLIVDSLSGIAYYNPRQVRGVAVLRETRKSVRVMLSGNDKAGRLYVCSSSLS